MPNQWRFVLHLLSVYKTSKYILLAAVRERNNVCYFISEHKIEKHYNLDFIHAVHENDKNNSALSLSER